MKREPIFNVPACVLCVAAALLAIHGWREYLASDDADLEALRLLAFSPGRLTYRFDPDGIAKALSALQAEGGDEIAYARFFLGDGGAPWWTLLTYSLLHADWAHCGLNCAWLVVFGAPVARRARAARFLALLAVAAIAGAALHWLLHAYDFSPVIGASASVSGLMAAATRFIFQPGGMMFAPGDRIGRPPLASLRDVLADRRAATFLLVWFGGNLVFGLASEPLGVTAGPVAWEAHVGGFLAGFLLFGFFDAPAPPLAATTGAGEQE